MGILLGIAVCLGIALILGVPFGIHAGLKSTGVGVNAWSAYFGGGFKIYLIQTGFLLAAKVFLVSGMEGQIGEDVRDVLKKLRSFAYFSLLPTILWLPVYTVTYLITKGLAS